jgi:hypothetical protein
MEFKKMNLSVPKEVEEFYDYVFTCDNETRITGTYLVETYLGKASFHVDFLLRREFFYETIEAISEHFGIQFQDVQLSTYSCTFEYKGFECQLHFVTIPEQTMYTQDVRLNEIYYYRGETFVSNEFLQDTNEKKVRVGIVKNPLDTLMRLFDYQERFSFSLDESQIGSFMERFNEHNYSMNYIKEYVIKHADSKLAQTIIDTMKLKDGDTTVHFTLRKENPNALSYLKQNDYRIHRDVFEKIYGKENFIEDTLTYVFSTLPGMNELKELQDNIKREFKKNKVKLLFHYPKETPMWIKESENPLFLSHVLPEVIKKINNEHSKLESFTKKIDHWLEEIREVTKMMVKIPPILTMNLTTNIPLYSRINPYDYVNDRLVEITIEGIGKMIIHKETLNVVRSSMNSQIEDLLREPIQYAIKGEKENGI